MVTPRNLCEIGRVSIGEIVLLGIGRIDVGKITRLLTEPRDGTGPGLLKIVTGRDTVLHKFETMGHYPPEKPMWRSRENPVPIPTGCCRLQRPIQNRIGFRRDRPVGTERDGSKQRGLSHLLLLLYVSHVECTHYTCVHECIVSLRRTSNAVVKDANKKTQLENGIYFFIPTICRLDDRIKKKTKHRSDFLWRKSESNHHDGLLLIIIVSSFDIRTKRKGWPVVTVRL